MAAAEVFAADQVLQAAQFAATSAQISGNTKAATIINHAAASLQNARAMAAAGGS
jgi:hypothetical protein